MNEKLPLIIPFLLLYGGISLTLLGVYLENKGQKRVGWITIFGHGIPVILFLYSMLIYGLFYYDIAVHNNIAFLLIIFLIPFLCIISGYITYYQSSLET